MQYILAKEVNPRDDDLYCVNYYNEPLIYYESEFTNYNKYSNYTGACVAVACTCCISLACMHFFGYVK